MWALPEIVVLMLIIWKVWVKNMLDIFKNCCRLANLRDRGPVRLLRDVLSRYVHAVDTSQPALLYHPGRHAVFSAVVSRRLDLSPSAEPHRKTSDRSEPIQLLMRPLASSRQ